MGDRIEPSLGSPSIPPPPGDANGKPPPSPSAPSLGHAQEKPAQAPWLIAVKAIAAIIALLVLLNSFGLLNLSQLAGSNGLTQSVFANRCSQNEILARMSDMNASIAELNATNTMAAIDKLSVFGAGFSQVQAALMRDDLRTACQIVDELERRLR